MKKLYLICLAYNLLVHAPGNDDVKKINHQIMVFEKMFRQGEIINFKSLDALNIEEQDVATGVQLGALHTRNVYRIAKIISEQLTLQEYFEKQLADSVQKGNRDIIKDAVSSDWLARELDDFASEQEANWFETFGIDDIPLIDFLTAIDTAKTRIDDYNKHFDLARYS